MSIQSALATAMSSLDMQQQQANVIAGNIANANTPGYSARTLPQLELVSGSESSSVMAGPLQRLTDETATAMANQTAGAQAYSQAMVNGLTTYTQVLGQPSDSTSLPSELSAFTSALTTLSASPDQSSLQTGAVTAAQNLVSTFNNLSAAIGSGREQADQAIASDVTTVNQTLSQIAQNEAAMQSAASAGESSASYLDTRDQLVSQLSSILPVTVTSTGNGTGITITTDQGTTLWDGSVHDLSFTATPEIPSQLQVTADPSTGYTGGLSQVTVDGAPIQMSQSGDLAAQLQLRDVTLPQFGQQLDQLATNTITAFQQADPTVASGQTGIFTDNGAAVDPTNAATIPGMAANIALNASVDPTQGGEAWRMVDGAQAATEGATGDNSTVLAFVQATNTAQNYDTTSGLPGSMTLTNASSQIAGLQQASLTNWTANNTTRGQQAQDAQTALSNATGVNVDDELQRLLTVQASYEATTQVIQAAAKMLDELNQLAT